MRINNNISSLNTVGRLQANQTNMSKSLEKLSSGLRIGRASDDAAGLGISEKMRGQIKGLNRAATNAQEAISLVQTAEGALGETHSILQRMRELAVQSASDTATNADRTEMQKEVDHLSKEITRISNTTEFNTKNLLSGAFGGGSAGAQKFQIGANENQTIALSITAMDAHSLGVAGSLKTMTFGGSGTTGLTGSNSSLTNIGSGYTGNNTYGVDVTVTGSGGAQVGKTNTGVQDLTVGNGFTGSANEIVMLRLEAGGFTGAGAGNDMQATADGSGASISTDGGVTWNKWDTTATGFATYKGATLTGLGDAGTGTYAASNTWTVNLTAAKAVVQLKDVTNGNANVGSAVTVHNNQSSVTLGDITGDKTMSFNFAWGGLATATGTATYALGVQGSSAATYANGNGTVDTLADTKAGISVSTQSSASTAVTAINTAINTVSSTRSNLGAIQNRLEHTINNLNVTSENMSAAESRIRDVDMAKEMSEFTKNQILSQAATAMLAQANQVPQGVLKLLG